ncbi:MAG: 4-hydroxy-tetrahydrodipicolinate reductase [Bacteroidales bacterium]
MKIAIIGYGKMGKTVENLAIEKGHTIVTIIDSPEDWNRKSGQLADADVAIDFSMPAVAVQNILTCFDANLPVVSGTTGWDVRLPEVREICKQKNQALFTASNFSIGVNIFFRLNRFLGEMMDKFPDYEIFIDETHHLQKLDAPSGTAKTLADNLIRIVGRKNHWKLNDDAGGDGIRIDAHREADVKGIHQITCDSEEDTIMIRHEAKSRQGFAAGALMAAAWLHGRKGFFTMDDLFDELL